MANQKLKQPPITATLRIGNASVVLAALEGFDVDPDEALTYAGIDKKLFDDPDSLITYAARSRLIKYCEAETGCPHFGLLVGQRMNLHSLGLLGLLMRSKPDAGAALRALVSYFHVHTEGAITTLKVNDDHAMLSYETTQPMEVATDQIGDGAVATMLNIMRTLCGPSFKAIEVSFAHRKPVDTLPFKRFFRAPLYFDAARFALVFSPHWLDAPLPGADVELMRLLQQRIESANAKRSLEFPEQVKNVLRSALLTGYCSESQIAELFGLTPRTLIRRLESTGTGFQALVDECRFEIAKQMLNNTSLQVGQIAESLGYARASVFIRAFRRWSGTTPARWRKRQTVH